MSENEINEILCFPGSRKNYAVDFSCVVELSLINISDPTRHSLISYALF